jgi:RNA-directed DNA polymerase
MSATNWPAYEWKDLPWRNVEQQVHKLQARIFRASSRGEIKTVHRLQRLLLASWAARVLAVRMVTQDNRGKKTAGVDGVKSLTPVQRLDLAASLSIRPTAKPVRRVWIPKPGKMEQRPLGIPTMRDRAQQTLARLALEPEWEARFEPHSYGFRPGRSVHDAIDDMFEAIHQGAKVRTRRGHCCLLGTIVTMPPCCWRGVRRGPEWLPTLRFVVRAGAHGGRVPPATGRA